MNKELYSGRDAVARGVEGERRLAGKTIELVFSGVDRVPAHDRHQPGMNQVISLHEAPGKTSRTSVEEASYSRRGGIQWQWDRSARGVDGQLVRIMSIHEEAVNVEGAIVDAKISACT